MERLFNWQIEKQVKDFKASIQIKEATVAQVEKFVLENNYYNGRQDEIYVIMANANHKRGNEKEAGDVYKTLFDKWKQAANAYSNNVQKMSYMGDQTARYIDFIPKKFIEYINTEHSESKFMLVSSIIDRYSAYEKNELLMEFLKHIPYTGDDAKIYTKIVNASLGYDKDNIDKYLNLALKYINNPINFLNNIKFSADFFKHIKPETLKSLLDVAGIQSKFDQFIKYESFMESLDLVPSLGAKFFIDISNKLLKVNEELSIKYCMKALQKNDFNFDLLKDCKCSCARIPGKLPSISEALLISYAKKGDYKSIIKILDLTLLGVPNSTEDLEIGLKFSLIALKLSKGNPEVIKRHIKLLFRRSRSFDSPEGLVEDERYKHKEKNKQFLNQVEVYKSLYLKVTGQRFSL